MMAKVSAKLAAQLFEEFNANACYHKAEEHYL
jgi:hypothetical protein